MKQNSLLAYQHISLETEIETATPHRLIQLYFEKSIECLIQAKTFMEHNKVREKGEAISQVIAIVNHLKACLDFEKGRDISKNLERLYGFMAMHLAQANLTNNSEGVDACLNIMRELKAGWDGIAHETNS